MGDRQPVEQAQGEGARLVGDDAERHARGGEPLERFADGRIERRRGADGLARTRPRSARSPTPRRRWRPGAAGRARPARRCRGRSARAPPLRASGARPRSAKVCAERQRDLAGGIGQRAIEVEQNGANRMHENRRHNETGAWLAPEGDSMHLKWLIAAPGARHRIRAGPGRHDHRRHLVPERADQRLQGGLREEVSERQGRDPEQGHLGRHRLRARAARRQPGGDLLGVGARRVRGAVVGEAAGEGGGADEGHPRQDRQLSDQRPRRPVPRPGARRLRPDVEHPLHAGAQAAGAEGMGRPRRSRSTSATSRPRRRRARARPTSPSRPSSRARAGTRAGTRSCRSPATAPRSPSAASACPTACRTASTASAW